MQVSNPLQLIDWDLKKFLGTILAVQIMALVLIWLDMAGFQVPVLRQLICFIYLTFVPGAVTLRAMNVRKLGSIESTLFTIGLSLSILMFTGALLNFIGPYLGLTSPIAVLPIMVMLTTIVLILSLLCFLRDKRSGARDEPKLDIKLVLSPPALFLCIIPIMSICGAYLMNLFSDNLLLELMILALAAVVLLVGFDRFIPKELYPLAIFIVAISLVFHNALISTYLNGWDIQYERYRAALVLTNGYWDPSTFNVLNAMLSIVMLAPIYSLIVNIDIVWVLKLVYPLLLALVPLGLYEVFRRQSSEKIAFMASFFFTSLVIFYTEMLQLARQEIAELFLVLVILLVINRSMDKLKWSILFVIFSFSVVISHYGLTYIFIASLVMVWAMLQIGKKIRFKGLDEASLNKRLSILLIMPLVIFCLGWYIFTASGNAFNTILDLFKGMLDSLLPGFLNPEMVQGMALVVEGGSVSLLHKAYLYLMLFTQAFIVIGIIAALFVKSMVKLSKEYLAFSLVMIAVLVAGISVPYFSSALNTTRLYQITLIFLAIFFVIGWLGLGKLLGKMAKRNNPQMPIAFSTLAIFLAVFLIFNTGLVFEVFNDVPISYSLNRTTDYTTFNSAELAGASWALNERISVPIDKNKTSYYLPPIYSDSNRRLLFSGQSAEQAAEIPANSNNILQNSFIYLGTYNLREDKVMVTGMSGALVTGYYNNVSSVVNNREKVYANGGAEIYH